MKKVKQDFSAEDAGFEGNGYGVFGGQIAVTYKVKDIAFLYFLTILSSITLSSLPFSIFSRHHWQGNTQCEARYVLIRPS